MKFLDVFRRKNKYKINPKRNMPRMVYGIPNPSKYDVKPNDNIPELVYGIPDVEKYNVCPDDNVPREVYGIPNPSKYNVEPKDNIPEKVYGIKVENRDSEVLRCKKCGYILKKYIYGKVTDNIDTSRYILGGCIVEKDNPVYHCTNCNIDFDEKLKPIIYSEKKEN